MFFGENITGVHGSLRTYMPKTLQRASVHNLKILASFKSLKIPASFNKFKKYDFAREKHRAPMCLNQKMSTSAYSPMMSTGAQI